MEFAFLHSLGVHFNHYIEYFRIFNVQYTLPKAHFNIFAFIPIIPWFISYVAISCIVFTLMLDTNESI